MPIMNPASVTTPSLRARLAVIAAGMSAFIDMYVTQALLPSLRPVFHASLAELGLTITLTTLTVAFTAPLVGSLSDRFGRKSIILISLCGLSLTTLLAATAPDLGWLLFWRTLQGVFIPGIFTVTVAYIGEEWPASRASTVTALYVSGTVLGGFLGRFLAGIITARYDWQAAFVALGIINLLFLPVIGFGLPGSRRFQPTDTLLASLAGMGSHLRNRPLLATYVIGFGILFSQVATFTYVNYHLAAAPFSLNLHDLSFVFLVYLVGMIATPAAGRLAPRFGARRLFLFAVVLGAAGMLLTLGPTTTDVIIGLTLSSTGVFIAQAMATTRVPQLARKARSSAVGLYVLCYYVGGSLGGVLPSAFWATGGWTSCVVLVILVQIVVGIIAWRSWRPHGQHACAKRFDPVTDAL